MLIKSLNWNVFLTWIQFPKMKHFCSIKAEKIFWKIILIISELKSDALQGQWQTRKISFGIFWTLPAWSYKVLQKNFTSISRKNWRAILMLGVSKGQNNLSVSQLGDSRKYPYHTTGGILEFRGRGGVSWTGIPKTWGGNAVWNSKGMGGCFSSEFSEFPEERRRKLRLKSLTC